jgi:hypothetical protein
MNPASAQTVGRSQHIAGVGDIADFYGVSKATAHYWTQRPDFPKPYDTPKAGAMYRWSKVEKWCAKHGHEPKGDGDATSLSDRRRD